MDEECIFCKIGGGGIPADILYRDEHCFVIRDIAPKAPTHLLIIPGDHITRLTEVTKPLAPVLDGMFDAVREMARLEGAADDGYRLVINQGRDSGQQVPHLHMHLLAGRPLGEMG